MNANRERARLSRMSEADVSSDEYQETFNFNQSSNQLVKLYDNLAVYSDYLMRLTQNQAGNLEKSTDRNKLFNKAGNEAGLALIKKSNDIKGSDC